MSTDKERALEKILDVIEGLNPSDAESVLKEATQMQRSAIKAYRRELGNPY